MRTTQASLPSDLYPSNNGVGSECYMKGRQGAAGTPAIHAALLHAAGVRGIAAVDKVTYELNTFHSDALTPAATIIETGYQDDGQARETIALAVGMTSISRMESY